MNPCRRKCWTCGNIADHLDDITPHVCCSKCGSQDTRLLKTQPVLRDPSPRQLRSACLSFRHDYGLLSDTDKAHVEFIAVEWLRAWQKEGLI